jgi:two-component system chemotaxis response regulator CheB
MANRNVVAIGTSAGGVEALRHLVSKFSPDLPASVLITIHLSSEFRSTMDTILTAAGPLPARFADDGEVIANGHIYIAPPKRHLLLDGKHILLGQGARENNAMPAIDPMFRATALCCGFRTIGVVLTGTLGDGASGLWALEQSGGITVVQDPADAAFPDMPETALSRVKPNHVVTLVEMPALLEHLVRKPAGRPGPVPDRIKYEVEVAKGGRGNMNDMDRIARRSVLACPDCHGVMWEIDEGDLVRYRCHIGHAYTAELMGIALDENLRRALASARRALEERTALAEKLHKEADKSGHRLLARSWAHQAQEFREQANVINDSINRVDEIAARLERDERRSSSRNHSPKAG